MADSRKRPGRTSSKRANAGLAEASSASTGTIPGASDTSPLRTLRAAVSPLLERQALGNLLGFGSGFLDLDTRLGYPSSIPTDQIARLYRRGDIAYKLVTIFPNESWGAGELWIAENEDPEQLTEFESAFGEFAARLDLWGVLRRSDIYSCVGEYGVIMIGAPGEEVDTPLPEGDGTDANIWYLTAYPSTHAKISQINHNKNSPDYGKPEFYTITTSGPLGGRKTSRVHASRIIHDVYDPDIDPWRAVPMLERVWDRFIDLKKLLGGGSESFFSRGKMGLIAKLDAEDDSTEAELAAFDTAMEEFQAGVSPVLRAKNVDVQPLQSKADSFSASVETLIKFIGSPFGIPLRKLFGNEAGQLASGQDERNWNGQIAVRRNVKCARRVADLIDRLTKYKYLPMPVNKPVMIWPVRDIESLTEKAQITNALATANSAQVSATGFAVMSPNEMRMDIWAKESVEGGDIFTKPAGGDNSGLGDGGFGLFSSAKSLVRKCVALGADVKSWEKLARSQVSRLNVKTSGVRSAALSTPRTADRKKFRTLCNELYPGAVTFAESMFADMRAAIMLGMENHLANSKSEALGAVNKAIESTRTARMLSAYTHTLSLVSAGDNFAKKNSIIKRRENNRTGTQSVARDASITLSFDANLQPVIDFAHARSSELVTEVERSTIEVLQALIGEGVDTGIAPRRLAQAIETAVGLRTDQIDALNAFVDRLTNAKPGSTVYAGDRKITVPEIITPEVIQAQSDKYAAKLLRDRAELIGRTEVQRSANEGLRESWSQSVADGIIVNAMREWIASDDDRTRDEHADMDGQTTGINESFDPPIEPGEEPNCRCSQALIID